MSALVTFVDRSDAFILIVIVLIGPVDQRDGEFLEQFRTAAYVARGFHVQGFGRKNGPQCGYQSGDSRWSKLGRRPKGITGSKQIRNGQEQRVEDASERRPCQTKIWDKNRHQDN